MSKSLREVGIFTILISWVGCEKERDYIAAVGAQPHVDSNSGYIACMIGPNLVTQDYPRLGFESLYRISFQEGNSSEVNKVNESEWPGGSVVIRGREQIPIVSNILRYSERSVQL